MRKEDVPIVIGGGIAGLEAALRLAAIGRDVRVVDPHIDHRIPVQTRTRQTMPFVPTNVLKRLGLSVEAYPEARNIRIEDEQSKYLIESSKRKRSIDAPSVRRTLLSHAQQNPRIDLVEGKAVSLDVTAVRGRQRVTGVNLTNGDSLPTGDNGLVVVTTGRNTSVLDPAIFQRREIDNNFDPDGIGVLGAYITSPALRLDFLNRSTSRHFKRINGRISPSQKIERGGTDHATYFVDKRAIVDNARGGKENALAAMQEITKGTVWEKYFQGAQLDRVLLYIPPAMDVVRNPHPDVEGVILAGDSRANLNPGNDGGVGITRIDWDTAALRNAVAGTSDLTKAAQQYNRRPVHVNNGRILLF